ncbi:MAG: COQ9 family protein [Rhizobiales bacterium]|nr:COQ9 family protein [Hyphomicrobiales bacterium]
MSDAKKNPRPGRRRTDAPDHLADIKARVLAEALPNAGFDGWSARLMQESAKAAGVSHGDMRLAFPKGALDLVDYFLSQGDRQMEEALARVDLAAMKIRERITLAVRLRLEADMPYREALRRAITTAALPTSGGLGPRTLYRTVDAIWRAVGDTSTDFNFYSKRAVLAGVYSSTVLHWFSDETEDFSDTWAFLDRRIENVMQFEKAKAGVKKIGAMLPDPIGLIARLRYRRG